MRGRPIPQGSLKFIQGRPIHVRAHDLALWRADIARNAHEAGYKPVSNAVRVVITFIMKPPKTVTRRYPSVKPDLDKLIRAVLDGLTEVAYVDDQQVVHVEASKLYGEQEGAWINIENL